MSEENKNTFTDEVRQEVKAMVSDVVKSTDDKLEQIVQISKNLTEQLAQKFAVNEDKKKELYETDPNFAMSAAIVAAKRRDTESLKKILKAADPNDRTDNADGAYTVPTIVQSEILRLIPTYSQALSELRVIPLANGQTVNFPTKSTGFTTSVVGENTSITSTKPAFGVVTLTASKFASLGAVTNELLADSNSAIGAYLMDLMMESMGQKVDSLVFQDDNTTWSGLFYASNTYGNTETLSTTNGNSLTYQNLVNSAYSVDQKYLNGAKWYMSRTVAAHVRGLLDLNNRPIFEPGANGMPPTLLGYPVMIVEAAPALPSAAAKTVTLLGNLKNSLLGDIAGYSFSVSDSATIDASSAFQYDLTGIRLIKRWSFDKGLTEAYATTETKAS